MTRARGGSTDPELLKRVAVLGDDPAWKLFFDRYDPCVAAWCASYRFDADSADELRQRVWVELTRRMPAYQYDPSGSFRGWLRRLCHHRAIDLYRERRASSFRPLGDGALAPEDHRDGEPDECGPLLREAREVQAEVRSKVKPARWEAFWRVVIEGEPIAETAAALGLKYATVYAGARHVADLLRAEGRRRQARPAADPEPEP